MTLFDKLPEEDRDRIETAIVWRQRLSQNPALELSQDYLNWISDPMNARITAALEEALDAVDQTASAPEILDLRRDALDVARRSLPRRRWWSDRRTLAKIAAVLVVAAIAGGVIAYNWFESPTEYETGVGERQVVALPDGSRISLDSDSEVHVRYTKSARAITLDKGRARFDVAHDVTRPFTVTAGTETVVAVGTSFNVERLGSTVVVTLIQGHVVIKDSAHPTGQVIKPRPVSLSAGEQLVAKLDTAPKIATANLQVATAWETGRLVFQDESLAEAVDQVNRYTDKPIIVDPSVASIRINGVFNAGDVGSFVSAVTSYFPVEATTDADNDIVLERK